VGVVEEQTRALVLIVEDDPWIRDISTELLEDEGFAIASAADGQAGLEMAERLRPTVILLDLGLPRMSGGEFLTRLRESASLRETPVIIVTAQTEALADSVTSLADGVLRKPVDLTELLERVQNAAAAARRTMGD
jgi:DNA-binding response OmpR family regulator